MVNVQFIHLCLVYFPYFEKIKGGLQDDLAVCVSASVNPPLIFCFLCSPFCIKRK
jgi:hypothetical protein